MAITKLKIEELRETPLLARLSEYTDATGITEIELPKPYSELEPIISKVLTEDEYYALGIFGELMASAGGIMEKVLEQELEGSDLFMLHLRFLSVYIKIYSMHGIDWETIYEELHAVHMRLNTDELLLQVRDQMENKLEPEEYEVVSTTKFPLLFNDIAIFRLKAQVLVAAANILRMVNVMHQAEKYAGAKKQRQQNRYRFLMDLAGAYALIGALDTAIEYYGIALDLLQKLPRKRPTHFHHYVSVLRNLALLYLWVGQEDKIGELRKLANKASFPVAPSNLELAKLFLQIPWGQEINERLFDLLQDEGIVIRKGLVFVYIFFLPISAFFKGSGEMLDTIRERLESFGTSLGQAYLPRIELIREMTEHLRIALEGNGTRRQQLARVNDFFHRLATSPRYSSLDYTTYRLIGTTLYVTSLICRHEDPVQQLKSVANMIRYLQAKKPQAKMALGIEIQFNLSRLYALLFHLFDQKELEEKYQIRMVQFASALYPNELEPLNPKLLVEKDNDVFLEGIRPDDMDSFMADPDVRKLYEEFVEAEKMSVAPSILHEPFLGKTQHRELDNIDLDIPKELPKGEKMMANRQAVILEKPQTYGFWSLFTEWEADVLKKIRFLLWSQKHEDVERLIIMLLHTELRDVLRFQLLVIKMFNDYIRAKLLGIWTDDINEFLEALHCWKRMSDTERYLLLASRNFLLFRKAYNYRSNKDIFEVQENARLITWMSEELNFDLVALLIIMFFNDFKNGRIDEEIIEVLKSIDEEELNPLDFYNIILMQYLSEKDKRKQEELKQKLLKIRKDYGIYPEGEDEPVIF